MECFFFWFKATNLKMRVKEKMNFRLVGSASRKKFFFGRKLTLRWFPKLALDRLLADFNAGR